MKDISLTTFGFNADTENGDASMADLLGGKGANLCQLVKMGVPVPQGVIIPTEYCNQYIGAKGGMLKRTLIAKATGDVDAMLTKLKKQESNQWMLFSVRSGARVSMPGMMDTILNVGMTSHSLPYWKKTIGERAALDCYRRLIQMYGSVVKEIPSEKFERIIESVKVDTGVVNDCDLEAASLEKVVQAFLLLYGVETSSSFPDSSYLQLKGSIEAVWKSWNSPRAITYRKINGYPEDWGTAVTIQRMVFGNMNDQSCSGVLFTRNPATGEKKVYGEFLPNAQGEDVVAGIRTPKPLYEISCWDIKVSGELLGWAGKLDKHFQDMQDIEFTVENGKLFILQTRNGKRSSLAAFVIAKDLIEAGGDKETILKKLKLSDYLKLTQPVIDPEFKQEPITTGLAAGGGLITGKVVFNTGIEKSREWGGQTILVAKETTPDDIEIMNESLGILTATGGITSHAAVVARGMNKACVVGATNLFQVDDETFRISNDDGAAQTILKEGAVITIDGNTGRVWIGEVPMVSGEDNPLVKDMVEGLFTGVDFIPVGRSVGDALNNTLCIPFSFYGPFQMGGWVDSVKEAVQAGVAVHVDLTDPEWAPEDFIIGSLVTPLQHVPILEKREALIQAGVYDSVVVYEGEHQVSLEKFVQGKVSKTLTDKEIVSVFGSKKAYKLICSMMKTTGVVIEPSPVYKTKMEFLATLLSC